MKDLRLELTKLRIKAECYLLHMGISPKGKSFVLYLQRIQAGEINDTNRISAYEDIIEAIVLDNHIERNKACSIMIELIQSMPDYLDTLQ